VKRVFVAIKIEASEEMKAVIHELKTALKFDNIKWVDLNNIHITITFIGDCNEDVIPKILENLLSICEKSKSFELSINGVGVFKNINNPTVLWLGVNTGNEINDLKLELDKNLRSLGLGFDAKSFNPHITIGRPKFFNNTAVLLQIIEKYKNTELQKQKVTSVCLYESILKSTGPQYIKLGSAQLI
jgi:2'-5' RNA ligase